MICRRDSWNRRAFPVGAPPVSSICLASFLLLATWAITRKAIFAILRCFHSSSKVSMQIFKRSPNRETAGLRLEILGLGLLLLAAIWQAGLADWFDRNDLESGYYIQEDVNIALLVNQKSLAGMAVEQGDKKALSESWEDIAKRSGNAIGKAVEERDHRLALQKTQASFYKSVRFYMALFGTLLIISGKYLVFTHKCAAASKQST